MESSELYLKFVDAAEQSVENFMDEKCIELDVDQQNGIVIHHIFENICREIEELKIKGK